MNSYFYDFDVYVSADHDIPAELLSGNNNKKLLIIVKEADYSDANKAFLAKVLSAIKYDLESDATIFKVPAAGNFGILNLLKDEQHVNVLIFGIKLKDLGFSVETFLYAPFEIAGITYLVNHSLEKIKSSVDFKKSLWTAMQSMPFN